MYEHASAHRQNGNDNTVFAEFFLEAVPLPFKSKEEGRPVFEDREHVRILIAGDAKTEFVSEATDEHKERFARAYEAFRRKDQDRIDGTPLKHWPAMTPALIRNFDAQNIRTVEQLAAITDTQIQNTGLGGREWRDRAKAFLAQAKDGAEAEKLAAENATLKDDIAALKLQVAELAKAAAEASKAGQHQGRRG